MKSLIRVLNRAPVSPPPVWLMRQAGRYLPEYKATRAKAGSFLDLCYTPELAELLPKGPLPESDQRRVVADEEAEAVVFFDPHHPKK